MTATRSLRVEDALPGAAVSSLNSGRSTARGEQRSVGVDLVRVLGVVAIVAGHTWDRHHFAQAGLYTWHVPVFFVITGYLWKSERGLSDEAKRRTRTLLVPYVAWLVIVTVVWFGFLAVRGEPFKESLLATLPLGGDWISRPYSAFWFITCLFAASILLRWLLTISPFLPWYIGGIGLCWSMMRPHDIARVPESIGMALPAIAFMSVGMALRRYRPHITKAVLFGALLALPAWLLGWSGAADTLNMKGGNLGTPVLSVLIAASISCGLLLIAEGIEPYLPDWIRPVVLFVASCAIPMILTHALVLAITERYALPSFWSFVLAFFVPLAIAYVLRRTPAKAVLF